MTDDEIMIEVRDWLARRPSTLMQNADWIALARALESRVLVERKQEPANQCDGCRVRAPMNRPLMHTMPDGGFMACTASRYLTHPTPDDAKDAARYRWLRNEHFPTADNPPLAQVAWKLGGNRHGSEWANLIDGNDLDAAIDAAMQADKETK